MSKLLKSKIFLGFMIVVFTFALVNIAAAEYTTFMKVGSRGTEVTALQAQLGVIQTGYFGTLTDAAVKAFQTSNGLVADGKVGALTRAALNVGTTPPVVTTTGCEGGALFNALTGASCTVVTYPAGCTSATGFSSTTGLSCATVTTYPEGCTSTVGYSTTTGTKCDSTVTTTPTPNTTFEGTEEGKLTSFEEDAPDVSDADEGTIEQEVLNVSFEADVADQKVTRVDVDFQAADCTQSCKPWDYFKAAHLTLGGKVIATKNDIGSSSAWDKTDESGVAYDTYTLRFSNLDFLIADGAEAQFGVAVDIIANVDGSDEGQSWEVAIPVNGIRGLSPNGLTETYPSTELNVDFTVAGSDTGTLVWGRDADDPDAMAITLDDAVDTNDVLLSIYNMEADNQDIFIEDVLIETTITTTGTMNQTSDLVQTFNIKIYDEDDDLVASSSAAGSTTADLTNIDHTFSNVDVTIPNGETYTVKIYADFQPLDGTIVKDTDTIIVSIDASDTVAEQGSGGNKGDAVTATGDITGVTNAVYFNAPVITHVSSVLTVTCAGDDCVSDDDTAQAVIKFTVKAVGADVYLPDEFVEDTDETDTTYGSGSSYFLDEHGGTEATAGDILDSNATTSTNGWVVYKGQTKNFTATINLTATASGFQSVGMSSIEWGLTDVGGGNAANEDYTYSLQPDWETNSVWLAFT